MKSQRTQGSSGWTLVIGNPGANTVFLLSTHSVTCGRVLSGFLLLLPLEWEGSPSASSLGRNGKQSYAQALSNTPVRSLYGPRWGHSLPIALSQASRRHALLHGWGQETLTSTPNAVPLPPPARWGRAWSTPNYSKPLCWPFFHSALRASAPLVLTMCPWSSRGTVPSCTPTVQSWSPPSAAYAHCQGALAVGPARDHQVIEVVTLNQPLTKLKVRVPTNTERPSIPRKWVSCSLPSERPL